MNQIFILSANHLDKPEAFKNLESLMLHVHTHYLGLGEKLYFIVNANGDYTLIVGDLTIGVLKITLNP